MCNFISAVAILKKRKIKVITLDHSDSHSDILESLGLKDTKKIPDFVKMELMPVDETDSKSLQDVESWEENVDQDNLPIWWTITARKNAFNILRNEVKKMFITGKVDVIGKGRWILLKGAIVGKAKNTDIVYMLGNSQIKILSGNSKVWEMRGNSKVDMMYDKSTIYGMYNKSKISEMHNSSQVLIIYDNSKVNIMCNNSKINRIYGSGKVGKMYNSSKVGEMSNDSKVDIMYDNTEVCIMYDNSKVGKMYNSSKFRVMRNNAKAE